MEAVGAGDARRLTTGDLHADKMRTDRSTSLSRQKLEAVDSSTPVYLPLDVVGWEEFVGRERRMD